MSSVKELKERILLRPEACFTACNLNLQDCIDCSSKDDCIIATKIKNPKYKMEEEDANDDDLEFTYEEASDKEKLELEGLIEKEKSSGRKLNRGGSVEEEESKPKRRGRRKKAEIEAEAEAKAQQDESDLGEDGDDLNIEKEIDALDEAGNEAEDVLSDSFDDAGEGSEDLNEPEKKTEQSEQPEAKKYEAPVSPKEKMRGSDIAMKKQDAFDLLDYFFNHLDNILSKFIANAVVSSTESKTLGEAIGANEKKSTGRKSVKEGKRGRKPVDQKMPKAPAKKKTVKPEAKKTGRRGRPKTRR